MGLLLVKQNEIKNILNNQHKTKLPFFMIVLLGEAERVEKNCWLVRRAVAKLSEEDSTEFCCEGKEKIPLQDSLFVYGRMKGKC